jgi:hypothetical protein
MRYAGWYEVMETEGEEEGSFRYQQCIVIQISFIPHQQNNEHELICMACMENGVNVDCLLMRKVPQPRYQYFMNIKQTKNRHRKQTRGSTFGGIVSEMRRSLGGAKISQGEAKCVRCLQCIGQIKHTISEANKQDTHLYEVHEEWM